MAVRYQGGQAINVQADKEAILRAAKTKSNRIASNAKDNLDAIEAELMMARRKNLGPQLEREVNAAQEYIFQAKIALNKLAQVLT